MTRITVFKNRNNDIFGFCAKGHADKHATRGNDIYCAYVSALTQTACNALEGVAHAKVKAVTSDGYLSVKIGDGDAEKIESQTIFKTLVLGLQCFDKDNPGHIQIFEEVQQ